MRLRYLGAALLLVARAAAAQTALVPHAPDFSVERLAPAPGPGGFLQVEDAELARHLGLAFTAVSSLMARPLVIHRLGTGGGTLSEPVALRLGMDLSAAVGWKGWLQAGLGLPVVAYQGGDRLMNLQLMEPGAQGSLSPVVLGDLRLHGKVGVVRPPLGYGFGLAGDLVVTLPTGNDAEFAGEEGVVVEARAIASLRRARWAAAVNLGPRLRTEPVRFFNPNLVMGQELAWGAAASLRLPFGAKWDPMAIAEVAGAWGGSDGPSPAEVRVGVRARVAAPWVIGVAAGAGVGDARAIGAPAWRGIVELRWEGSPVLDLDGDGIPDASDRCPTEPEDFDGFQDADGCPDPDNDGDGIPDDRDQCPNEPEDFNHFRDWDGCPDPDNDGDGIPDKLDKCPNEAEDKDGFQDSDGCPERDNDGDGIPDELDKCPNNPEDKDGFQDEDGCPDPDNDGDGVPDTKDLCPTEAEDKDGWQDDDGCFDGDDDRDLVPDAEDKCPDQPETDTSLEDDDNDGCPDPGKPMVVAAADGTIALSPAARAELAGGPRAARVALAVARVAHHAGWDAGPGVALVVTVPGDAPAWGPLADRRSSFMVAELAKHGVRARVEAVARPTAVVIRATPEALEAAKGVRVKGVASPR